MNSLLRFIEPVKTLYDFADDGILITDLQGIICYVNPSFTRLTGYKAEAVMGKHIDEFKHPDAESNCDMLRKLGTMQTTVMTSHFLDSKGKDLQCSSVHSILTDVSSQACGVLINFQVKCERHPQQDYYLEQQAALLRALNYRMDEMCVLADVRTHTNLYCTDAIERILGWTAKEYMEGGWSFVISTTHPEDMQMMVTTFIREMDLRKREKYIHDHIPIEYTYRKRHKDGSWRWLRAEGIVLDRDDEENVRHLLTFSRDITRDMEVESTLSDEELRELVQADLNKLLTANERAVNVQLSHREKDILKGVIEGLSTKEIADRLELTTNTVNTYRKIIMNKLNAKNTAEMVRISIEQRIL